MTAGTLSIVGSGGHAKVVIATARAAGWTQIELADDDPGRLGQDVLGVRVSRTAAEVLADPSVIAVIAIGDNDARCRLGELAACGFATIVHPSATVDPSVSLGGGTVVFAGVIVQPSAVVDRHGILNTGCSVDHDSRLGVAVHIAPGARLCGGVIVGDRALVGVGAVIIPNIKIGAAAIIGAGAAVVDNVAGGATMLGVPARPAAGI